ncbi:MAG: hypothetical protein U9R54_08155 [Bacteroidota bacterium]|nr:hypothetical protein [Bacteroidota bacterium]
MNSNKKYILIDVEEISNLHSTINKNAYAFYMSLQIKFNNNIFYNYSLRQLAKLTRVSESSANKYINILLRWNRITIKDNNLYIHKEQKKKKRLYKYHLYRSLNKNKFLELLNILYIDNMKRKQQYAINLKKTFKTERKKKLGDKSLKQTNVKGLYKKYKKYGYAHGGLNEDICINSRLLARKLNIDKRTALRILHNAAKNKLIFIRKKYKFVCNVGTMKDFLAFQKTISKNTNSFKKLVYKKGKVYQLVGYHYKNKILNSLTYNNSIQTLSKTA